MSIVEDAKQAVQGAVQGVMAKAVALAPDSWVPGGVPDPLIHHRHGHVGKPVSRIDGPLKAAGQARFASEFPIEGMAYAALVHSTIARGRITRLETEAAENAPGVVAVMTYRNAPRLNLPPVMSGPKAAGADALPILQSAEVYWNGEPIAVVLAEAQEQADHAASLITAEYEVEPASVDFAGAIERGTRTAMFMGRPLHEEKGDVDAALRAAAASVDSTYTTPRHNHNAIELHGVTVAWEGGTLRIHDASQLVSNTAWSIAQIFGIPEDQVIVTSPFVGGGFGGKCLWQHQVLAAAASKLAGRPVRLVLTREGVYRVIGGRSLTRQRVALGADAEGRLEALVHTGVTAKTSTNAMPEPFIVQTLSAYAMPAYRLDVQTVELDMLANTFMRAPGEAVGTFALESAIDELAEKLGIDPVELRLRNEPEKDPVSGLPFSARHVDVAWRQGAERFGWANRHPAPRAQREGEWLIGMSWTRSTFSAVAARAAGPPQGTKFIRELASPSSVARISGFMPVVR